MRRREKVTTLAILLILVAGIWCNERLNRDNPPKAATTQTVAAQSGPPIDKSPQMQQQREALIKKAINLGYFREVEVGSVPKIYVRPAFMAGDFKDKQSIASVVYAFYFSDYNGQVCLIDARTNKQVGSYSPRSGLSVD